MLLANLRASGLSIASDGEALIVEPRSAITEQTRALIRTHKHAILQELARERIDHSRAIVAAREGAKLGNFRAALHLGHLHICGNCASFRFAPDPAALGHCTRFTVEAWAFVPFTCPRFEVSAAPAAPAFLPDPDGKLAPERELAKAVLSSVSVARGFRNRDRYG
jgi:hypothetical protein